jgi:hypothetical protein
VPRHELTAAATKSAESATRVHGLRLQAVNYFGGDGSAVSAPAPVLARAELDRIATAIADQVSG